MSTKVINIKCKCCTAKLFEIEIDEKDKDNTSKIFIKCKRCKTVNKYYIFKLTK